MNINDYGIQKTEFDMHKRKCEELRKIRLAMAKTLGVPEVVRDEPCNFNGECQGTCPACYMEEKALMDRIYELSQNGVVFTLKGSEFEKEQEEEMSSTVSSIVHKPPVPPMPPIVQGMMRPMPPMPPQPPIVQGGVRPMPPMPPTFPESPIMEPEQKKRGIFDKIKRKK